MGTYTQCQLKTWSLSIFGCIDPFVRTRSRSFILLSLAIIIAQNQISYESNMHLPQNQILTGRGRNLRRGRNQPCSGWEPASTHQVVGLLREDIVPFLGQTVLSDDKPANPSITLEPQFGWRQAYCKVKPANCQLKPELVFWSWHVEVLRLIAWNRQVSTSASVQLTFPGPWFRTQKHK